MSKVSLKTNNGSQIFELSNFTKHDCIVYVSTDGFSANTKMYTDGEGYLAKFVRELKQMLKEFDGQASIGSQYEPTLVTFKINKIGHVLVEGELQYHPNTLKFSFKTDQTVLEPFIKDLEEVIN